MTDASRPEAAASAAADAPETPAGLTHTRADGAVHMVDVSGKPSTARLARAGARVQTRPDVVALVAAGSLPKGETLATARIAGILAAKQTHLLIPLCHPLAIDAISVEFEIEPDAIVIEARVTTRGPTGVEMEALTAASIAALTVYDMIKAVDRAAVIADVRVLEKRGGKSDPDAS